MTYKWSSNRPRRPDRDPQLVTLRAALVRDGRSTFAKANVSGLAPATINHILDGTTRSPHSVTVQMAWRMLGFEMKPVPIGRKGR